jgi:hypothetical protein
MKAIAADEPTRFECGDSLPVHAASPGRSNFVRKTLRP